MRKMSNDIKKRWKSILSLPDLEIPEWARSLVQFREINIGYWASTGLLTPFQDENGKVILPYGEYQSNRHYNTLTSRIVDSSNGEFLLIIQLYNNRYGTHRKVFWIKENEHEPSGLAIYQVHSYVSSLKEVHEEEHFVKVTLSGLKED